MAGTTCIADVERMLQELKVSNDWSNTKLVKEVRERGICLKNGKEYGADLPVALKKNRCLVVRKDKAKAFPLAKKCLVKTPV